MINLPEPVRLAPFAHRFPAHLDARDALVQSCYRARALADVIAELLFLIDQENIDAQLLGFAVQAMSFELRDAEALAELVVDPERHIGAYKPGGVNDARPSGIDAAFSNSTKSNCHE